MLDQLTPETPRIAVRANNETYVLTATFRQGRTRLDAVAPLSMNKVGDHATFPVTHRECGNNVQSGHWQYLYLCNEHGRRLVPMTAEEWQGVCNSLRDARIAASTARDAVTEALKQYEAAKAAQKAADKLVRTAQQVFDTSL